MEHSYVFWLGDLNYRINETIDNIKGICGKKEYSTLWKHDQVDNLFHSHYLEGRATFPRFLCETLRDNYSHATCFGES